MSMNESRGRAEARPDRPNMLPRACELPPGALLGFHRMYSVALLDCARRRLTP